MSRFESVFAKELDQYIDEKIACGYKSRSFQDPLKVFDHFCISRELIEPVFTQEDCKAWRARRPLEATTTHYSRVNKSKHFLHWLQQQEYDVCVPRDIKFRPTDFKAHIYTEEETTRYFRALDDWCSTHETLEGVEYPVLFRLLYSCGSRIGETVRIKKEDVDLEKGLIVLRETKNGEERLLVLGNDMWALMKQFARKRFFVLKDSNFIFAPRKKRVSYAERCYDFHRLCMRKAGIPYLGEGEGPRIHDWRHSMATKSFHQLSEQGIDLYTALPILSVYLGHKTIHATERYLQLTAEVYPDIDRKLQEYERAWFGEPEGE